MKLSASDIRDRYVPSPCLLRAWLGRHGVAPAPPGAYEQVVMRLGQRHETAHLDTLGAFADLRGGGLADRAERTRATLARGQLVYQGVLTATTPIGGIQCEIVGMATYIEAVETEDRARREELMGQILKYNEEDLAATWAVLCWLQSKTTD